MKGMVGADDISYFFCQVSVVAFSGPKPLGASNEQYVLTPRVGGRVSFNSS